MHFIQPAIEQLDLAGRQLHLPGTAYARFALLLADNMVELMCHQQAEFLIMLDQDRGRWASRRFTAKDEQDALGQRFDEKVKFVARAGKLTEEQRDFILRAHQFRNECYHAGLVHEDILWDLAWSYHDLACELVVQLRPGWAWGLQFRGAPSPAIQEHLKNAGLGADSDWLQLPTLCPRVVTSVKATKPASKRTLSDALSASAMRQLERLTERLQFIAEDGLQAGDADGALKAVLFRRQPGLDDLKAGLDIQADDGFREWIRRFEEAEQAFKPPVTMKSVERWQARAADLKRTPTPSAAIVRYTDLRREFSDVADAVAEAAMQLDREIQHQIDVMRGK
jgi:hypothetical protein